MNMLKRFLVVLLALTSSASAFAQEAADLERRLRAIEEQLAKLQSPEIAELRRQIEVLGQEIEALKTRQTEKVVVADTEQFGLGAAASKVYRVESGISFGGYGEMLYENYAASADNDVRTTTKDKFDMLRGVLYTGYKYNDRVLFNSEIEFEHGNTALGGEASVEFAYLDFLATKNIGVRTGLLLVPMGLVNEKHEPTTYLTARRAFTENAIIPTTWREMGAGLFGEHGPVSWRAYAVNSIRGDRFSSGGVRGGRQKGANAQIENIALTGRVDYTPFEGTTVGGAFFSGNTGQGNVVAGEEVEGNLTIFDLHGEAQFRGATIRALWAQATLDDVAQLNALQNLTGNRSIGEELGGWYVEAGYDVSSLLPRFGEASLTPYLRYEQLDTQRSVPTGFARNPASELTVFTYGIQFRPTPETVIKWDYQNTDNEAGTGLDQWNIGIGYIF
jgi:Ni/Co efflux regulator RcnB